MRTLSISTILPTRINAFCHSFYPLSMRIWNNLQTVQRKAARFVCNDYYRYSSVSDMLQQLGWPTLECQRLEARATMVYNITNNLVQVEKHMRTLSISTIYLQE